MSGQALSAPLRTPVPCTLLCLRVRVEGPRWEGGSLLEAVPCTLLEAVPCTLLEAVGVACLLELRELLRELLRDEARKLAATLLPDPLPS